MSGTGMEEKKFDDLLTAWWNVDTYVASSGFCSSGLMTWLQEHTLRVVLSETWSTKAGEARGALQRFLRRLQDHLPHGHAERDKLQALAQLADDPWGDPLLRNILVRHVPPDDPKVEGLLARESAPVTLARAAALAEARCEDLALALLDACLHCAEQAGDPVRRWAGSQEQLLELYDARIMLWHHFERVDDIIRFMQCLSGEEGAAVVRRLLAKDGGWRLWREQEGAAQCVFQWLLTSALAHHPLRDARHRLRALVPLWPRAAQLRDYHLLGDLRKMLGPARSAYHVFALAQTLTQQFGGTWRAVCIELYIRGITTQMNDLAHAKSQQELMKIKDVEFRLSTSLMELADLLRQDVSVWRECILTAFSLNPTHECFGQVECAATESSTRLQAPTSMEIRFSRVTVTDVYLTAGRCGSVDVLLDPRSVLDADALGLSPELCDDLAVILRCLRYQALQWSLEWGELKRRCIQYMEDIKERINSPSELRFLKIDFDNLKNSSCEDVRSFFGINGTSPQWNENAVGESCVQMSERSYKEVYPDEKMEIVYQEVKRTSTSRISSSAMSEVTTRTSVGVHVSQSQSFLVRTPNEPVDETTGKELSEDEWQDTKSNKSLRGAKKHRSARGSKKRKSCVKIDRSLKRKVVGIEEHTIVEDSFTEVTSLDEADVVFEQTTGKIEPEMEDSSLSWLFQDDLNLNSIIENIPNGAEADQELQSAMEYFDLECPPMDEIATHPHTFPVDATEQSLEKVFEKSLPMFDKTQIESIAKNEIDASLHPRDQKTEALNQVPLISQNPENLQLRELDNYLENRTSADNVRESLVTSSSCIKKTKKRRKARKTWDITKRKTQPKGKPSRFSQKFLNLNTLEPHIWNCEKSAGKDVCNRRSLRKRRNVNEDSTFQEIEVPSQARMRRPRWDSVLLDQCYKQRVRSITCRKLHFLKENGDIDCDCPEQEKKSSKRFETSSREEVHAKKKKGRKTKRSNSDESGSVAAVGLPECCDQRSSDSFIMQDRSVAVDTPEYNNCRRENFMKVNLEQGSDYTTQNSGTPPDTSIISDHEMSSSKRTRGNKQKIPSSDSLRDISVPFPNGAECIFPTVEESSFVDHDTEYKNEDRPSMNVHKEMDNIFYEQTIDTLLNVSNTACQVIDVPTKSRGRRKKTFTNTPKKTLKNKLNNRYYTDFHAACTLSPIQEIPREEKSEEEQFPASNGETDIFALEQYSRAMNNQTIETPTRKREKKSMQSKYSKRGRKQKELGADGSNTRPEEDAVHGINSDSTNVKEKSAADIELESEEKPNQLLANDNTPKNCNDMEQNLPNVLGISNALEIKPTRKDAKMLLNSCTSATEPVPKLWNGAKSSKREHDDRLPETMSGEMQHLIFKNGAIGDVDLNRNSENAFSSIVDFVTSTKNRTKEDALNITSREISCENETEQKHNDFPDPLILLPVEDVQENLHMKKGLHSTKKTGLECDNLKQDPSTLFDDTISQKIQTSTKKRGRKPKILDSAFLTPAYVKESPCDEVLRTNGNAGMERDVLEQNSTAFFGDAIPQETQTPSKKRSRKPKAVDSTFSESAADEKEIPYVKNVLRPIASTRIERAGLEQNTPVLFCDMIPQKTQTSTKKRGRPPKVLDYAILTPVGDVSESPHNEVPASFGSNGTESDGLEQSPAACVRNTIPQEMQRPTKKRGRKPKVIDSAISVPDAYVQGNLRVEKVIETGRKTGMKCDCLKQNLPAHVCDMFPQEIQALTRKRVRKPKVFDSDFLAPSAYVSEIPHVEVLGTPEKIGMECDGLEQNLSAPFCQTMTQHITTSKKKRGRKPNALEASFVSQAEDVQESPHVEEVLGTFENNRTKSGGLKQTNFCHAISQATTQQTTTNKRVRKRKVLDSECLAPAAYIQGSPHTEVRGTCGSIETESDDLKQNCSAQMFNTPQHTQTPTKKRGSEPKVVESDFSPPIVDVTPMKKRGRKPKVLDSRCNILSTVRTIKKIISSCQIVEDKPNAVQRLETTTNKKKKVNILIPETIPPFQFANQSNSHNREGKSFAGNVFSNTNFEEPPLKNSGNEEICRGNFQDKSAQGSTNMGYSDVTTTNKKPKIDKMLNSGKVHNVEIENKINSIAPVIDDKLDIPNVSKGHKDEPPNIIQIGLAEAYRTPTEPVQKVVNVSTPQSALKCTLKHFKATGPSLNIIVLGECSKVDSLSKSPVRKITLPQPADPVNHKKTNPKNDKIQTSQESSIRASTRKNSKKSPNLEKTNQVPINKPTFSSPILLPLTFSDGSVRNYIVQRNIQPQTKHSVDDAPHTSNVLIVGNSLPNSNPESTSNTVFRGMSQIPVVLWDVSQNVISTPQTSSQPPVKASKSLLKPPLTLKCSQQHPVCTAKPPILVSCSSVPSAQTQQLGHSQKPDHISPWLPTMPPKSSHQPGESSPGPSQIPQVNLNSLHQTPPASCDRLKQSSGLVIKSLSHTLPTSSPQGVCKMSTAHSQNNSHPTTNMLGQISSKLQLHPSETSSEPTPKMPPQHPLLLTSQQYSVSRSNAMQHPPGLPPEPSQQCSVRLESSHAFHRSSPNPTKPTELCSDPRKETSMQISMLNSHGLQQPSGLSLNSSNLQCAISSKTVQPPSALYSNTSNPHSSKSLPPTSGRTPLPSPKHDGLCQKHSQQPYVATSSSSPHTCCSDTSLHQPLTLIPNLPQPTFALPSKTSHPPRGQFSKVSQQHYVLSRENSQKHSASLASLQHSYSMHQQSLKLPTTLPSMSSQQLREVTLNNSGQRSEGTSKCAPHSSGLMPLHSHQPCQHSRVALQHHTMLAKSPQQHRELPPKEMCKVTNQKASMASCENLKQTSVLITKPSPQTTTNNLPEIIETPLAPSQRNKLTTTRLYRSLSESKEVSQPSEGTIRPLQRHGEVARGKLLQQQFCEISSKLPQGSKMPPLHCVVFSLPRSRDSTGATQRRGGDSDQQKRHQH